MLGEREERVECGKRKGGTWRQRQTITQLVSELGKERDQVREDDAENALKGSAKGNTARASVSG